MPKQQKLWPLAEHTKAKHEILKTYLGAWIPIMGLSQQTLLYIDGFCGPGRYEGGEDGSPIIALKIAIEAHSKGYLGDDAYFVFSDENPETVQYLWEEEIQKLSIPKGWTVDVEQTECKNKLREILDVFKKQNLKAFPTFAFIDPFGFSGVPLSLIEELLSHGKTEVFVNLMIEGANRFLSISGVEDHLVETFGTRDCLDIKDDVGKTEEGRSLRIRNLADLYDKQLKNIAKFVRGFEIRGDKNKTKYFLFFAGNNSKGFSRMKAAMWKVDETGQFTYSLYNRQLSIGTNPDIQVSELLLNQFAGKSVIGKQINEFVDIETDFLLKHKTAALKRLESLSKITVDEKKRDGSARKKGSYPDDCIVRFS